jgi:hypothetical protein
VVVSAASSWPSALVWRSRPVTAAALLTRTSAGHGGRALAANASTPANDPGRRDRTLRHLACRPIARTTVAAFLVAAVHDHQAPSTELARNSPRPSSNPDERRLARERRPCGPAFRPLRSPLGRRLRCRAAPSCRALTPPAINVVRRENWVVGGIGCLRWKNERWGPRVRWQLRADRSDARAGTKGPMNTSATSMNGRAVGPALALGLLA